MGEIALTVRILVALVFLTAAFGKFRHRGEFRGVVANYRLVPGPFEAAFAEALPVAEVILAAALLFDTSPWPAAAASALLLLFAGAMGINILRGRRQIDCGCFQGALRQSLSWPLVARNVGLALMLVLPLRVKVGTQTMPAAAEAILAGLVLFFLLQSMNLLWSVVPAWRQRRA